jgi:glycosyltransferase involved in cell wall biosynthesis
VRPIRVALLAPSLIPGGAERQMLSLAERLPRDRFEVEFVLLSGLGVYEERATAAGIPIRTVWDAPPPNGPLPARLWHRASKGLRYAAVMRAGRYDIVDAWLYPADVLAALMRPVTRTAVIITGRRNVDPQQFFGPLEDIVASVVARLTDVVVANSAAVASNAVSTSGLPRRKVRIIRNGVLVAPPVSATERTARRLALGVSDPEEIIIGCVANYLGVKRHALLIDAFAALTNDGANSTLVLVGEGPLRPDLERQIRELGLEGRVRLHGSELDPQPLYAAFDIVVQASSREGLPNALLEAGAAGRPIVATAAGGSGEIVIDGVTGLLVPVEDGGLLAGALGRLVADPDLRDRLGAAAREHIIETFGMDRFVAEFARLYQDQAASKNIPPRSDGR